MLQKKDFVKLSVATSAAVLTLALGLTILPRAFADQTDTEPGGSEILLPEQSISYEISQVVKTFGDGVFINPLAGEAEGAIAYESSDTNVATIDAETGEVTIVASGTTIITATAEATEEYAETTVFYELVVNKKEVSIVDVTVDDKTYDGNAGAVVSAIALSEDALVPGVDFTAEALFESTDAGDDITALVYVELKGAADNNYFISNNEYATSANIIPFLLDGDDISIFLDEYIYSGDDNMPTVTVMAKLDGEHDTVLIEGEDFEVTYPENTKDVGVYNVIVNGLGNYDGTNLAKEYRVEPYEISNANISLEYSTVRYDGEAKTPEVSVMIGDFEVDASEYDVLYADNTEIGIATVTVTAKDGQNITGEAEASFNITEKDELIISGIEDGQEIVYTGAPVELVGELRVAENYDGITVSDLTTTWYNGDGEVMDEQPITAGRYTVEYAYNGENYEGSLTVIFEIIKAESPEPVEMTEGLTGIAGVGQTLADLGGTRTLGFEWAMPGDLIGAGEHRYVAYYTYNGDVINYTTIELEVPVYGLSIIDITAEVDGVGGGVQYPDNALEGDEVEIVFEPAEGYELSEVLVNSVDLTDEVVDNTLTLTAGTTDIDIVVRFIEDYDVVEGDGETYPLGNTSVRFKIDADYYLFREGGKVYVDGVLLPASLYTSESGSTVITLSPDYVSTLSAGEHSFVAVFNNGAVARANFTLAAADINAPDTGFFTSANGGARAVGAIAIGAMTAACAAFVCKKKFAGNKIDFDKK